ncbi:Leucine-rich repeat and calponin homology domain-containing protein 3, partial [Toxocara canis]
VLKTASSWRKRRGNGNAVSHTPPIAPASIPSTSHQQQLLSRSVDKMFEEAELSGVLMLASRKLKEFPTNLAIKYDISDVISADLSDNRLNELPICICELSSMETLRVRATGLRSLPAAVQLLESLTYLDLSENQLSTLPIGLFSIRLQVLLLTGNRLESLPREIRQLAGSLHELDVSCNRLRAIPADIALLKLLRVLNMRDNRLTRLPSELSRMELRILDVSENELGELPSELRHMCSLIDLRVEGNPLATPPVSICSKGREHVFKWLRAQANTSEGGMRPMDWSMNRPATINATLRRGRYNDNGIDMMARRVERRSRSTRFNTLGGSDSGYASTVDEHRYSHEYQAPTAAGCLFGINESLRSPSAGHDSPPYIDYTGKAKCCEVVQQQQSTASSSSSTSASGGLLNEVMSAYAEKYQAPTAAGCLFGINESLRSPSAGHDSPPYIDYTGKAKCCEVVQQQQSTASSSSSTSASGGLLNEVMSAYAEKYQAPTAAGCLFGINESLRSPSAGHDSPPYIDYTGKAKCCEVVQQQQSTASSSSSTSASGGLLNEVMSAYAEKMGNELAHDRSAVTSTSHRSSIERALLYSSSSILSSSSSSLSSSATITHRPQAIVSPMTAVSSSNSDSLTSVKSAISKETLIEGDEFTKADMIGTNLSSGTTIQMHSSRSVDEAMELNNNNNNNNNTSSKYDSGIAVGASDNSRQSEARSRNLLLNKTLNVRTSDSTMLAFKSPEIETVYTMSKQRIQTRGKSQDGDQPKILSPVIEVPSAPGDDISTTSTASIAVRSSFIPESGCSTVRSISTTASVSSAIKAPKVQSTRGSGGSPRGSSSLSSSRSSVASSRAIPTLKRPPVSGAHIATRTTTATTNVHTTTALKTSNKLTKARDSLGLARNHLNGNTVRKTSSAVGDKARIAHANDTHTTPPMLHSNIASTVTHTTTGVIENMRKALEQRLNITLPHERDQLATSLADGIHLCNFANSVRIRAVPTVLTPPLNTPLSFPKCRRNVENFLSACRRIGVPEVLRGRVQLSEKTLANALLTAFIAFLCFMSLSSCSDIVEGRNLPQTARTVAALSKVANATANNNIAVRPTESRRITNV